jgi:hypothetical protein
MSIRLRLRRIEAAAQQWAPVGSRAAPDPITAARILAAIATGQHPPKVDWLTDGELAETLAHVRDVRERLRPYQGEN